MYEKWEDDKKFTTHKNIKTKVKIKKTIEKR